jgi:hypothetical protein
MWPSPQDACPHFGNPPLLGYIRNNVPPLPLIYTSLPPLINDRSLSKGLPLRDFHYYWRKRIRPESKGGASTFIGTVWNGLPHYTWWSTCAFHSQVGLVTIPCIYILQEPRWRTDKRKWRVKAAFMALAKPALF